MTATKTLAFEIGSEEIPAFDLKDATLQLEKLVPELLDNAGIEHGEISIYTTPRRQIFIAKDVMEETAEKNEKFKGPNVKIAFDEAGKPTKAAIGFAKGKDLDVSELKVEGEGDSACVYAYVHTPSVKVIDLLPDVLLNVISGIKWPKSCNWGSTRERYSRPIRWLFAMLGDEVIDISYADVTSSNTTIGHRFLSPGPHIVKSADDLLGTIEANYVVKTQEEREERILGQVKDIETKTGLRAEVPAKTLVEVVNLCEYPTCMVGTFNEEFLKVPEEIIVDAMLMHQRYFPLYERSGKLSNKFIIISNGNPQNEAVIVEGNERVVAARLFDAKFFYEEDLKKPLIDNVEKLNNVIYQVKLGTIKDKNDRNVALAERICGLARISGAEKENILRATLLAKADLPSQAVIEFTSVQGIMGSYYATASGENASVALAIKEHYCPKFSGDVVPSETCGKVVALADKLDTVCSLIAVGECPTGSSDPFGVRRAALGCIALLESGIDISLVEAIEASLNITKSQIPSIDIDKAKIEIVDFFKARAEKLSRQKGVASDTVAAVMAAGIDEPIVIISRSLSLEKARNELKADFDDLSLAYSRAKNLSDSDVGINIDESYLNDKEKALISAIDEANKNVLPLIDTDFDKALVELAKLRKPVDEFFESTMIMDDDLKVRENRLKILNRFLGLFKDIADFGKFVR